MEGTGGRRGAQIGESWARVDRHYGSVGGGFRVLARYRGIVQRYYRLSQVDPPLAE